MRKLYVCGSFRFADQMSELEARLQEESVEYQMAKKIDSRGFLGCLKKIDDADVVYVISLEVTSEKAYALTLNMLMPETNRFTPCTQ